MCTTRIFGHCGDHKQTGTEKEKEPAKVAAPAPRREGTESTPPVRKKEPVLV